MRVTAFNRGVQTGVLLLAALLTATGTGCSSMKPGNPQTVAIATDKPRVGNVYLFRGFIGVFSTGMDELGQQATATGVRAEVYQDSQWSDLADQLIAKYKGHNDGEPIVLVGHSYGADDIVRIARKLDEANVPIALLITLDPVTAPPVPKNVKLCVNLYQSNGMWDNLPWLRGVPLKQDSTTTTKLVNSNIRTDRTDLLEPGLNHFNIEKKEKVHQEVLKQMLAVCVPREQWLTARANESKKPVEVVTAKPVTPAVKKPVGTPLTADARSTASASGN